MTENRSLSIAYLRRIVLFSVAAFGLLTCADGAAAAPSDWISLGQPGGESAVYRRCDGSVTVYVAMHNSQGVSISTVPPVSSGFEPATPCSP